MSLTCPACDHALSPMTAGPVTVDACHEGCGGIWFDLFELQKVDEPQQPEGRVLLHIQPMKGVVVDPARKRACPRCPDILLWRHPFSRHSRVVIDECGNCGGIWLDAGELEQIRLEAAHRMRDQKPPQQFIAKVVYQYLSEIRTRGLL